MDDDDSFSYRGDVDCAGDPAAAFHAHLPERAFEMLYVGLTYALKAVGLDEFHDALEVRAYV